VRRIVSGFPARKAGYGTGGILKPVMAAAAASTDAREEELVAGAQAGSPEAFEALFRRYRDRIASYVRASVRDEGRTEDLVQEIFFAAHSSLSALEHPAAFRSWLYQIARNACLDEVRRRSRQEDLILGWEEFPPPDERIVIHNHDADRALSQKEELANLTQALDGLPESQHEALVLRELEGMSYDEIGRRMRLSRHAVESVLFRARRGLKGEYAEIQTGRRCRRMQALMARIAEGLGDLGERRKLIRHMRDCAPCRREATALGLAGLAVPSDDRRGMERAFSRLAAFLPFPAFFGRRAGEAEQFSGASSCSFAAQAQGAAMQLTTMGGDHLVSVMHKAATVMAAVAVVGGSGVALNQTGVTLPVKLPVLDTAKSSSHHDRSGGGKGAARGKRSVDQSAPAKGNGGASTGGAAHQAPIVGSPTALTAPDANPPAIESPPSGDTPDAPASEDPSTPAAADTAPTDSQTFTSDGGAPPVDPAPSDSGDTASSGGSPTPDPAPVSTDQLPPDPPVVDPGGDPPPPDDPVATAPVTP
jgi:RNA polymerase sigma factor (sigma-70 family)